MKLTVIMSKIFSFDIATYYNWLKEERLILTFLHHYFSKEELEYIAQNDGRLEKLELIKNFNLDELKEKLNFKSTEMTINSLLGKLKLISQNNRGSLLYLYVVLRKNHEIKTYNDLIKFLEQKIEPKKFIESIIESINQLNFVEFKGKTDNVTRKGFAKKLHTDIQEFFIEEDINFIINYKFYFEKELEKILFK